MVPTIYATECIAVNPRQKALVHALATTRIAKHTCVIDGAQTRTLTTPRMAGILSDPVVSSFRIRSS